MKLQFFAAFILAAATFAVRCPAANEPAADLPASRPTTRPDAGARLDAIKGLLNDLNLTDDQKQKAEAIIADSKEEVRKMTEEFQANQTPPRERMQKIGGYLRGLRDKVSEVLTDEQKTKFQERVAALRGAAGDVVQRLQDAVAKLELTDDQKAKLKDIFADARQKIQDLRAEAQKAGDTRALGEKLRALADDIRKQLADVLTPEQQEKLKELLPGTQRRNGGGGN